MSTAKQTPHVLIIGGGLGGLALAQTLRANGISYEIFEKDASEDFRFEGWCISLHGVINDLKSALPADVPPLEQTNHLLPRSDASGMTTYVQGKEPLHIGYDQFPFIRANRRLLRHFLSTQINIQWGKQLTRIEESESTVTATFADGTFATGDMLVGADGINSIVRDYLFHGMAKPKLLPLTQITGEVTLTREQAERQMKLGTSAYIVRKKAYRYFVGLRGFSEDLERAEFYWLWAQIERDEDHGDLWPKTATKQEQYDYVMSCAKDLEPEFAEILHLSKPDGIHMPPLIFRDLILDEIPSGRTTLLGDAAHPMIPYRGEGGNQAMKDGVNLGRIVAETSPQNVTDSLKKYEDEMLARGSDAVRRSRAVLFDEFD